MAMNDMSLVGPQGDPHRWLAEGGARYWVEQHHGEWNHDDWLRLLAELDVARSPLDPPVIGAALERAKAQYHHLLRWRALGHPRRWVEQRRGQWDHSDWVRLLDRLEAAGFEDLDQEAVGEVLEDEKRLFLTLEQWVATGSPRRWVAQHQGRWDHSDWLALLIRLGQEALGPVHEDAVGAVLEEQRVCYWNLRRWVESGHCRAWVHRRNGSWTHDDWLELLTELNQGGSGPMDPVALGEALEHARIQYANLQRWQESDHPRLWMEEHQGQWDHAAWVALLVELRRRGLGEVDPVAVGQVLEQERRSYQNLRYWQDSGEANRWVAQRDGRWDHEDWLELLARIERSSLWPIAPQALGEVLDDLKTKPREHQKQQRLQAA